MSWLQPAAAQTSAYWQVAVAGSFNGWNTGTNPLHLVANNTWQGDFIITNKFFEFKFAANNSWAVNWGDNNQPNTNLHISGTAESGGANIKITNGTENSYYRFTINTSTREYTAFLLNNIGTNLLFNGSFEIQGSDWYLARYWEANNPNLHGNRIGSADRSDYGGARTGTWKGQILGTGLGSGSGTFWQEAPVEMGLPYRAAAWFQAESLLWTSAVQELRLEFYDFNKTSLLASVTRDLSSVSTLWGQHSITAAAPPRAAWGRLVFNVSGAGSNGTLRIDDTELTALATLRDQDFNAWGFASSDDCHLRTGWLLCTGRTVSSTLFDGKEVPLARSGYAASLANPQGVSTGSYIQTPRLADGIGAVSFWYRHSNVDTNSEPSGPGSLAVQISFLGDVWTNVAVVNDIYSSSYRQFYLFLYQPNYRYVRILHTGGSTNRLFIDDIAVAAPVEAPRLMDFNSWPDTATNSGLHAFLEWQVRTGLVSSADAKDLKAAQLPGTETGTNFLRSPRFSDGYGTISFSARIAPLSARTAGVNIESSPDGTNWTVIGTVSNVETVTWQDYSLSYFQPAPHFVRLRNMPETNLCEVANIRIKEPFDNGGTPPFGWMFTNVGQYTSADYSGLNPPALQFNSTNSVVSTPTFARPTNATFFTRGASISTASTFTVQGLIGTNWTTVIVYTNLTNSRRTNSVALATNITALRFLYGKVAGNLAFDDLLVTGPRQVEGAQPPQTLLLDDVFIQAPVEYRLQDFDAWPLKMDSATGTTQFQNWVLGGASRVNTNKAFSGQSLQLARESASSQYYVDLEGTGESTPNVYASNNITLSGLSWVFIQAITGPQTTSDADWYNGTRAVRLRGYSNSCITMVENKVGGLGTISFQYRRYGTDSQADWMVQYSTNNGVSWIQAGSTFTAPASTNVSTFTATVNVPGGVRIRIKRATETGSTNRRLNIDDILLTGYGEEGGTAETFVQSHYFPAGIGPITFQYRHWMDSPPPADSILTTRIQTSSNGVSWITADTLAISNTTYRTYDQYLFLTNHYYARLLIEQGNGVALLDNISIARPQPRANVRLAGWNEPTNPYTNDWVTLKAQAFTEYGARGLSVTSFYRIGTSGAYQVLGMTTDGETYTSISNIPPQPTGTVVQYYFKCDFQGPGSPVSSPVYYPTNGAAAPAWYGIPRNPPGKVWINEIDYDAWDWFNNYEFIELAGYAGVNISGWRIELRDGRIATFPVFGSYTLPTNTVILNQTNGFGFFVLGTADLPSPPRNMLLTNYLSAYIPGGVRLFNEMGGIEQSLSYGGSVPAYRRIPAEDIEDWFLPPTNAVVLVGIGATYNHFGWIMTNFPTAGAANPGQTFANPGMITPRPTSLTFSYIAGSYSPPGQSLVVSNSGASALTYSILTNVPWVAVTPGGGTDLAPSGSLTHIVSVNTDGLTGNKSAQLSIEGNAGNSPLMIPVTLNQIAIGDAILDYPFNNSLLNQGTAGAEGHLSGQDGLGWTANGGGVSGTAGDYALVSETPTSHARTPGAVSSVNNVTQFTLTGWIKTSATGGIHRLIGNRAPTNGFLLLTSSNYQNLALVSSASGLPAAVVSTGGAFAANSWQFFAVAFNGADNSGSAIRFYRGSATDGAAEFSTHARGGLGPTGVSTGQVLVAGDRTDSFQGQLDALRFYSGALDLMTIEAIRRQDIETGGEPMVPPVITQHPASVTQNYFTILALTVTATGNPEPEYQWRKGGISLPGEEGNSILFNPLGLEHAGVYDVIVSNLSGWVISSQAVVVVLAPPSIGSHPTSIVAFAGETVNFSVNATGTPALLYQWYGGGTPLPGQTNSILTLVNIQTSHAGSYYASVTNRIALVNSLAATLTVRTLHIAEGGWIRPSPDGAGLALRWPVISNRWYEVWWSSNLMMGVQGFIPVATNINPPIGTNFFFYTDTVHGVQGHGFYHIRSRTTP